MKDIAESTNLDDITHKLAAIATHLLSASRMRCSLNAMPQNMADAVTHVDKFIASLPGSSDYVIVRNIDDFFGEDSGFVTSKVQTHFELPFQVNYFSRSFKTVPFTHEDFPR